VARSSSTLRNSEPPLLFGNAETRLLATTREAGPHLAILFNCSSSQALTVFTMSVTRLAVGPVRETCLRVESRPVVAFVFDGNRWLDSWPISTFFENPRCQLGPATILEGLNLEAHSQENVRSEFLGVWAGNAHDELQEANQMRHQSLIQTFQCFRGAGL